MKEMSPQPPAAAAAFSLTEEHEEPSYWLWGFAVLLLLLLVLLHQRLHMLAFDDSYIHLRVARNLLQAGRAWFNPGERVMSTSSPLWTLLLAAFRVPTHPSLLPILQACFLWGAVLQAYRLVDRVCAERGWPRLLRPLFAALATLAVLLPSSVGLMETPLAIFFLLSSALMALDQRWQALPFLALAAGTRLEVLPIYFVALVVWVSLRREWKGPAVSLLIVLAITLWVAFQFHTLLPHTMHAKQVSYNMSLREAIFLIINRRLRDGVLFLSIVLLAATLIAGLRRNIYEQRAARAAHCALAAIGIGLFIVGLYIGNRTPAFEWYRPLYRVPFVLAVSLAPLGVRTRLPQRAAFLAVWVIAFATFVLLPVTQMRRMLLAGLHPAGLRLSRADEHSYALHATSYLALGPVLHRYCPQGLLMTSEIGALGWSFTGYVDDAFGIASPRALAFQPLPAGDVHAGIPVAYALERKPEMIVSYSLLDGQLIDHPEITQQYLRVVLPPSLPAYRDTRLALGWDTRHNLDLWLRRDAPCDLHAIESSAREAFQ